MLRFSAYSRRRRWPSKTDLDPQNTCLHFLHMYRDIEQFLSTTCRIPHIRSLTHTLAHAQATGKLAAHVPTKFKEFHVFWWSRLLHKGGKRGGHLLISPPLSIPLLPPPPCPPARTRTLDSASTSFLGSACPGKRGNSGAHEAVRLRVSRSTEH